MKLKLLLCTIFVSFSAFAMKSDMPDFTIDDIMDLTVQDTTQDTLDKSALVNPGEKNNINWKDYLTFNNILTGYFIHQTNVLNHELGHLLVGKKLFNCNGSLFINPFMIFGLPNWQKTFPEERSKFGLFPAGFTVFYHGHGDQSILKCLNNPEKYPLNGFDPLKMFPGKKSVATLLAGPMAHVASSVMILKGCNIAHEYQMGKSFDQALIEGLSKPVINKDQDKVVRDISICSGFAGLLSLMPTKNSDGYYILQQMKINPDLKTIKWGQRGLTFLLIMEGTKFLETLKNK